MNEQIEYLTRSFTRMSEEAVQSAQQERANVMAQAAMHGVLNSGSMLLAVKSAYDRAATTTADKMVKLAFDLTGSTAKPICTTVEHGLRRLRDTLSNDLTQFFRGQAGWAQNATAGLSKDFLDAMDKRIVETVDDLSHGIAGGMRLNKDPLVNVISKITNSPGAVLQGGIGNVQHARTSVSSGDIRSALAQFVSSQQVQGLAAEDKQGIADVADVLVTELEKQEPDAGRIGRWGKRLIDIAERLGVGVAASGLSHVLFG